MSAEEQRRERNNCEMLGATIEEVWKKINREEEIWYGERLGDYKENIKSYNTISNWINLLYKRLDVLHLRENTAPK